MKTLKTAAVVALTLLAAACSVAPDAGYEAVLVQKPILFGHGGVSETPVKAGRTFVAPTTDAIYVNVQPIQFTEHFDDLMSSDGVPLDFDASLRMRVLDSVKLVRDFGLKFYETNVQADFRKLVRDEVKKHGMNETAINASAAEEIDNGVTEKLTAVLKASGVPVGELVVNLGRANPPDSIKTQRTETAAQEQRVNTEKQRELAEQVRKRAETTRAEADNAYRQGMQLSPEQFIQLKRIEGLSYIAAHAKEFTAIVGAEVVPTVNVR